MIARSKVVESRRLTPSAHMIRIEKPPGFRFAPVQFCGLEIVTSEGSEEYPMSLACSPTRPYLEFGARLSGSPWKRAFAALTPGDEVEIDGAYGDFLLEEGRDALFLAGGIGVTPLKGMAEFLADTRSPRRAIMLYSNRSEQEIAYRSELTELERAHPRFRVIHTLTQEPAGSAWTGRRGRIDPALVREATEGLDDPVYYLCGRGAMVMGTGRSLVDLGVPRDNIAFEVFRGYH